MIEAALLAVTEKGLRVQAFFFCMLRVVCCTLPVN